MTSLRDLLRDPSKDIAFVLVLSARNPATDVVTEYRYATTNWYGAGEGYKRYLDSPGHRDDRLQVDELEAVVAGQTYAPIVLSNMPVSPGGAGPLDALYDLTLADRPVTLYAGHPAEPIADYEPVLSGVAAGEPVFDGAEVEVRIKSALARLDSDLSAASYVGEPGALRGLTSALTAKAATASTAAYNLARYTLIARVHSAAISSNQAITRRQLSAANRNWRLAWTAAGGIELTWTVAGVTQTLTATSTGLDDGGWHTVVASVGGSAVRSYLAVDGEVQARLTAPAAADTGTTTVEMLTTVEPWALSDLRIYSGYMAEDEAIAAAAVRATGDEQGLVGLWRGDDRFGATLTDYSPTAAHATVVGTEGVDYEWAATDLGTAELAGKSMPVVIGDVRQVPADLVDPVLERWRVGDASGPVFDAANTRTVRDQGEELAGGGVSYDWDDQAAVFETVAEAGEPVTVELAALDPYDSTIKAVLEELMVARGPLDSADLDTSRLRSIYSNRAGVWTRRGPVRALVESTVRGALGYLTQRADGTVAADALVPPTAPSPRDGACLEIVSTDAAFGGVTWASPAGAVGGQTFTVAAWVKTHHLGPSGADTTNRIPILESGSAPLHFGLSTAYGIPRIVLRADSYGEVYAPYGPLLDTQDERWFYIAAVHDAGAGVTRFYAARRGASLALVSTVSSTLGFVGLTLDGVTIGGGTDQYSFRGSVFEPQIWSTARTLAQLQGTMDAAPVGTETGLAFYAPCDGSTATSLADRVSSVAGSIAGDVTERPDLVLDYRTTDSSSSTVPRDLTVRRLRPASSITVRYARSYAVLGEADIVAAVPDDERADLQQEWRELPWRSDAVEDDYLSARQVTVDAPWYDDRGARATQRLAVYRFAPGRQVADVPDVGREGLTLQIGDEVRVYADRYGHAAGPVYRVIANRARLDALTADLELFR